MADINNNKRIIDALTEMQEVYAKYALESTKNAQKCVILGAKDRAVKYYSLQYAWYDLTESVGRVIVELETFSD